MSPSMQHLPFHQHVLRTYDLEGHHRIPWQEMSVKDRSQMKQLPDWLRRAMQLPERFRKGHGRRVPHEVEATFNEVLERMLAGFNRDLQAVTNLKMPVLVETAKSIFKKWAQAYKKLCEAVISYS